MTLFSLGWNSLLADAFVSHAAAGLVPARVSVQHKHAYELLAPDGPMEAACTGRLLHSTVDRSALPAVGDWVAVRRRPGETRADIHAVLPRRTRFSRRAAGEDFEQVVAANVDTVLVVTALDRDYNLRRLERYLAVSRASGAAPVIVLNKADLHPDPAAAGAEVAAIAPGTPVVIVSAAVDGAPEPATICPVASALAPWLVPGATLALLGSSGVGKSTLINRLLGEDRQRTGGLSGTMGKGRHTTTRRELLLTPSGAIVIDTPGMRELQIWDVAEEDVDQTFADIAALAARCRFGDCAHRGEPGCAVQAAREDGTLAESRWQSYQKLQREQAYAARRADPELERANQAKWKKLHRQLRARNRVKYGD
ncbi:MAG: ribosome small subunit-dependent GTPase A [Verrucomicrobia bacterium]|nr:ribosome small subunit-dependent GTPase A [Verrucomicrobiota bacterium]